MSDDATPRAAGETHAGINPKKGAPARRPTPPMRRVAPALREAADALDVLQRVGEIGIHWWSLIDSVLEAHKFHAHAHPEPLPPIPQWAVDRLMDQGRHRAAEEEFSQQRSLLKDWLHLAAGDGSQYRYEIWTTRGSRIAFRFESLEDAAAELVKFKANYPDAFVARVHVMSGPGFGRNDSPELLDTLVGKTIHHIGTSMVGEEDEFTVQDDTGRQVTVAASILRAHPIYERLDKRGRESLDHYLADYKPRQERIRKAAKADGDQP